MQNDENEDDLDAPLTPEDEELAQVSDYLFGEMDAAQRAAFERRLEKDAEFAEWAKPLIGALQLPQPSNMITPREVAAAWRDFARQHGLSEDIEVAKRGEADAAKDREREESWRQAEKALLETVQGLRARPNPETWPSRDHVKRDERSLPKQRPD